MFNVRNFCESEFLAPNEFLAPDQFLMTPKWTFMGGELGLDFDKHDPGYEIMGVTSGLFPLVSVLVHIQISGRTEYFRLCCHWNPNFAML